MTPQALNAMMKVAAENGFAKYLDARPQMHIPIALGTSALVLHLVQQAKRRKAERQYAEAQRRGQYPGATAIR